MNILFSLLNNFFLPKSSKAIPLLHQPIYILNMKTKQSLMTFLMTMFGIISALGQQTIPPSCFTDSHDITSLHPWGPYSKRYAGISHIPDMKSGMRFDFSVMPGYYRNRQLIPHVLFESSYYPWDINPSMNCITYRYEMEWKDRVFADVTY